MKYPNVEFERISLRTSSESTGGSTLDGIHLTDQEHGRIIGIAFNLSDVLALPNQTIKLRIDGKEVFPANFETEMIYQGGANIAPNDKYFSYLNIDIDKSRIDWELTDGNNSGHLTYNAYLYLMVLRKDDIND